MTRQQQEGACLVQLRSGHVYGFARTEYEKITGAWRSGITSHFEGIGLYGAAITLRLDDILVVHDESPEAAAAQAADLLLSQPHVSA